MQIVDVAVADSTTKALIRASGNGARVTLGDVTISGGTLKTSGGGQITALNGNTLSGVTLAASSLIDVTNGTLTLMGGTVGAGAIIETLNGGTAIMSGTVTNGGVALIGDGIVDIAGASGESVKFLCLGMLAAIRRASSRVGRCRRPRARRLNRAGSPLVRYSEGAATSIGVGLGKDSSPPTEARAAGACVRALPPVTHHTRSSNSL